MKEQVWQQLVEYLQKVEDFGSEQLPELIVQVLRYERITAITTTVVTATLLALVICIGYLYWKNPKRDQYGSRPLESVFGIMFPAIFATLLLGVLGTSVNTLIKVYAAPKYFLLQLFLNMKT